MRPQAKTCPKCKSLHPVNSKTCSVCGHTFRTVFVGRNPTPPKAPTAPTPPGPLVGQKHPNAYTPKQNRMLYVGLTVVALFGVLLVWLNAVDRINTRKEEVVADAMQAKLDRLTSAIRSGMTTAQVAQILGVNGEQVGGVGIDRETGRRTFMLMYQPEPQATVMVAFYADTLTAFYWK